MEHTSLTGRIFRGAALTLVLLFFMFPIVWILLMSFQSNEQILRIPPRLVFEPTLSNYRALISGQLQTTAGNLEISFMHNLWNSFVLSSAAVVLAAGGSRPSLTEAAQTSRHNQSTLSGRITILLVNGRAVRAARRCPAV